MTRHRLSMKAAPALAFLALTGLGCGDDDGSKEEEPGSTDSETEEEIDTEALRVEAEVDGILSGMTLEQKAAQMVQAQFEDAPASLVKAQCFGSVFNGGEEPITPNTPENWKIALEELQMAAMDGCGIPILYGIDAVHGNAKVAGATVFPHGIGLGATRDTDLVERVGQATAKECRALGIHMTFAPCVSVPRDERWGRTYEGFGETPELAAEIGAAYIRGLQGMGDLKDPGAVAATAKHFLGDGGTLDGVNNGANEFGEETMRAVHLPPYQAAVEAGLAAVMPSYHKWHREGIAYPLTLDTYSITDILKTELGFDGFVLSDYDAIPQADNQPLATYTNDNVAMAVAAGVDMAMIAADNAMYDFIDAIFFGVGNEELDEAWIDDAVRRILRIKVRMNLFDNPYPDDDLFDSIWSDEHQELAREAVQKSLVLLKNDGDALPLDTSDSVVVAGAKANKMGVQAGGWTIGWQGSSNYTSDEVMGETILEGLQELGGDNVTWDEVGENLDGADKIVVVLGEPPYAEGWGDHGKNGNSVLLEDCANYELLAQAMDTDAEVILVIISGRPLVIDPAVESGLDAIVAAWLPGSRGIGVADVLYGEANFSGKLPHTWPRSFEQIPINVDKQDDEPGFDAADEDPLYEYGHGLAY